MAKAEPAPFVSERRFSDTAADEIMAKLPTPHIVDAGCVVARVRHLASVYLDRRRLEEAADHASKIVRKLEALRGRIEKILLCTGRSNRTTREKKQLSRVAAGARNAFVKILNERPDISKELGFDDPLLMLVQEQEVRNALGALDDPKNGLDDLLAFRGYLDVAIASIEGRRGGKRSTWSSRAERRLVSELVKLFEEATGAPATGTSSPDDGTIASSFGLFLESVFWHIDHSEPPSRTTVQSAIARWRVRERLLHPA